MEAQKSEKLIDSQALLREALAKAALVVPLKSRVAVSKRRGFKIDIDDTCVMMVPSYLGDVSKEVEVVLAGATEAIGNPPDGKDYLRHAIQSAFFTALCQGFDEALLQIAKDKGVIREGPK